MPLKNRIRIAIFASGRGSNAARLIEYFNHGEGCDTATVNLVVCNKSTAGVMNIARAGGIPPVLIEKNKFESDGYLDVLREHEIELIVLAGFLWKIPKVLIEAFPDAIVNIHPALLPKYGGKGMYGAHVHEAVLAAGETESGITIHYVDGHYDNGDIIFQAKCDITTEDDQHSLAEKIHQLEYEHFPAEVHKLAHQLQLRRAE